MVADDYFRSKFLGREEYLRLPFEERLIKLSKAEDERAKELHEKLIKIDLHCHGEVKFPYTYLPNLPVSPPAPEMPVFLDGKLPMPLPQELYRYFSGLKNHTLETYFAYWKINWEGLKKSGVTGIMKICGGSSERYEDHVVMLGLRFADIDRNPLGKRAFRADDIRTAKREGKIAFIAATEANPLGNVLDRVSILYGLGFRQIGMTYEQGNYTGGGNNDPTDMGLRPFGVQVVHKMNELGMMMDLSHVGKKTAMDIIKTSADPVILSHNGAHGVYPKGGRCRDDDQLKYLAEKGGVIGISGVPNALSDAPRQGIKNWFDHADYCVKLLGINHVAVGMDINWMDHMQGHKYISGMIRVVTGGKKDPPAEYMEGVENPTEAWHNIIRVLVAEGYSDQEIEKIAGANALNLIEKVIG